MRLEDLTRGFRVEGIIPGESVVVLDASWHGADSVAVVYRTRHGRPDERVLYRSDEPTLAEAAARARPSPSAHAPA